MQGIIKPVFNSRQAQLHSTLKPVTPFGGLLAFNLLSLYQQAIGTRIEKHYQRPATLRSQVFLGGAILGNQARRPVLYIAQSWGGADKHKPLIGKVL